MGPNPGLRYPLNGGNSGARECGKSPEWRTPLPPTGDPDPGGGAEIAKHGSSPPHVHRRAGKSALALPLLLVVSLAAAPAGPASARSGTPTVKITSQPPASTSSTTAAIAFTASNANLVECSLDGGNFFGCVSPENYAGLSVGKHKVVVRATRDRRSATASAAWQVVASPAPRRRAPVPWPSRPRSQTARFSPGRSPGRRRRARRSARFSSTWTERSIGRRTTRPSSSTATATSSTRPRSTTAAMCFASWRPQVTAPRPRPVRRFRSPTRRRLHRRRPLPRSHRRRAASSSWRRPRPRPTSTPTTLRPISNSGSATTGSARSSTRATGIPRTPGIRRRGSTRTPMRSTTRRRLQTSIPSGS